MDGPVHYPTLIACCDWCELSLLEIRDKLDERAAHRTPKTQPGVVYSLMSQAARIVARTVTPAALNKLPKELHEVVQKYTEWWDQLGVFWPIRGWYPDGQLHCSSEVAFFADDSPDNSSKLGAWKLHGTDTRWNADGSLRMVINYDCGEVHGSWQEWYKGLLVADHQFAHGKPDGLQRDWAYNMLRYIETEFRDGKENGYRRTYDMNTGRLRWEIYNCNGKRFGTMRTWDRNGFLLSVNNDDMSVSRGIQVSVPERTIQLFDHDNCVETQSLPPLPHMRTSPIRGDIIVDIASVQQHGINVCLPVDLPIPAEYVTTEQPLDDAIRAIEWASMRPS